MEFSDYLTHNAKPFSQESGITFHTDNPEQELLTLLTEHVSPILNDRYDIINTPLKKESEDQLKTIDNLIGNGIVEFPQVMMINIESDTGQQQVFTLIHNNAHSNISSLFSEESNREPQLDTLTLVKGILGSYPAAFLSLQEKDVPELVRRISEVKDGEDYKQLLDRFAIRRSDSRFWPFSDKIHEWYKQDQPIEYGLLDYNRFENR